ncbi:hypothetical protein KAT92_06330 [Candidatus Babeliales bacterium]|nr:hypothetical protein [Candidatus Babeliales bacterium]
MESKYPPLLAIEEDESFPRAWDKAIRFIMKHGSIIPAEEFVQRRVLTRDVTATIMLTGKAVNDIIDTKLHPSFPTGNLHKVEYMNEFTYEFLESQDQLDDEDDKKFIYTYIERFVRRFGIDQLVLLSRRLRHEGISRRNQAITWDVNNDYMSASPPCLQRIWIRPLDLKYSDGTQPIPVELHFDFRSRDAFGAWPTNIIGIVHMIINYVLCNYNFERHQHGYEHLPTYIGGVKKHEYTLVKVVSHDNSLHIYEFDWDAAEKINHVFVK